MIRNRGLTAYAVARGAGLDPGIVSRFLAGQRDLRLASADAIAGSLGLKLVESANKGRGKARPSDGPAELGMPRPPEAPDRELDDFTVNLSAEEVYDESDGSPIATNPDPSPEGRGNLSQNQ